MTQDTVALAQRMLTMIVETARAHNLPYVECTIGDFHVKLRLPGGHTPSAAVNDHDTQLPFEFSKDDLYSHSQWEPTFEP